jgi:hypothetical protein
VEDRVLGRVSISEGAVIFLGGKMLRKDALHSGQVLAHNGGI